ncbi:uncharacterized protein [Drosophila tropicalis]|uniref:uncharacterized protein n=1 Tax=Drosophila tropicalis TaxID=46794 RepID=UPI0035AB6B83
MSVQLMEIGLPELQEYHRLFTIDWPKYCQEYYCLDNFINFLKTEPNIRNLKAYTLSQERAKAEGVFLIVDRYQLFVGGLNNNANGLVQEALEVLDWSKGLKCSSIPMRHVQALENVIKEKELKIIFKDPTNLYYIKAEEALKLKVEPPGGFHFKTLDVKDAQLINEAWPNRHLGSLYFIQRQIRLSVNVGLYADDTEELLAWCIRLQGGYLGALQVRESHKRRGLGSLLTREISHRIASLGQDVMALVNPKNAASCGMFDKLGFKVIDQCLWLRTEPTNGEFTWLEGE